MKRKIKFLVYPFAVVAMTLFVIVGCDDDNNDIIDETLPALTTTEVTDITRYSAVSGGNISYDGGGFTITIRGVVWGLEENPTLDNNQGYTTDGDGVGGFVSNITNLEDGTKYYVRSYATNINGTGYGNNLGFETPDVLYGNGITDIDKNFYTTVIIDNQEWMAENLRVTRYNNKDAIPTGLSNTEWSNTTSGAYAIYNNDDDMLEAYGKLYNWYAVDDTRGLCPEGWSIPSDADLTALVNYVVSEGFPNEYNNSNGASNALKSCRQADSPLGGDCDTSEHPRWNSHDTHYGFDEFGFSALPGGYRHANGYYGAIGDYGSWWSSSEYSSTNAWSMAMFGNAGRVFSIYIYEKFGFSVRCFRDID